MFPSARVVSFESMGGGEIEARFRMGKANTDWLDLSLVIFVSSGVEAVSRPPFHILEV